MDSLECETIFKELIPDEDTYKKYVKNFVDLHQQLLQYKQKTVDPIVTLRNLKYCSQLSKIDIPVRAAAEIAYSARFPYEERKNFESILSKNSKTYLNLKEMKKIRRE